MAKGNKPSKKIFFMLVIMWLSSIVIVVFNLMRLNDIARSEPKSKKEFCGVTRKNINGLIFANIMLFIFLVIMGVAGVYYFVKLRSLSGVTHSCPAPVVCPVVKPPEMRDDRTMCGVRPNDPRFMNIVKDGGKIIKVPVIDPVGYQACAGGSCAKPGYTAVQPKLAVVQTGGTDLVNYIA